MGLGFSVLKLRTVNLIRSHITITCTEVADGALWQWHVNRRDSVTCAVELAKAGEGALETY